MKKAILALVALALLAGCDLLTPTTDPFVGTWIGHGEATLADTPSAGHTEVFMIDDVITFRDGGTFRLDQVVHQFVDGMITASALQQGTGTWSRTAGDSGTLTMAFDATSDPSLSDGTPSFAFSADYRACEIQPATVPFPLEFQKVD